MSLRVKICGLCGGDQVEAVAALGPDAIGFVFWTRSPRAVSAPEVAAWTRCWPAAIRKVGVFVDESADAIRRIADQAGLDIIQLHAPPDPDRMRRMDRPVWQLVRLDSPHDIDRANSVDALIVDRYSADAPGGTGRRVDWSLARRFVERSTTPVVLAGGLAPENVAEAIRRTRPWGVDVSTGVESAPGRKDLTKVEAFIEQCRSC